MLVGYALAEAGSDRKGSGRLCLPAVACAEPVAPLTPRDALCSGMIWAAMAGFGERDRGSLEAVKGLISSSSTGIAWGVAPRQAREAPLTATYVGRQTVCGHPA